MADLSRTSRGSHGLRVTQPRGLIQLLTQRTHQFWQQWEREKKANGDRSAQEEGCLPHMHVGWTHRYFRFTPQGERHKPHIRPQDTAVNPIEVFYSSSGTDRQRSKPRGLGSRNTSGKVHPPGHRIYRQSHEHNHPHPLPEGSLVHRLPERIPFPERSTLSSPRMQL